MPYIYCVHNLITDEFYYGSRYVETVAPEEDLWIRYFTSSRTIKRQIDLYGLECFSTTIIETHTNKDDCYRREQDIIKEYIAHPKCLNKQYRECGNTVFLNKGHSEETKAKISKATKGKSVWNIGISPTDSTRKKISDAGKGVAGSKKGISKGPRPLAVTKKIVETRKRNAAERKLRGDS